MSDDAMSDALTIVINLPQPIDKVTAVLLALADEWPDAKFIGDHIHIAAYPERPLP